jgi:hypothetical protein
MRWRTLALGLFIGATSWALLVPVPAAAHDVYKRCRPVVNPYPDTRYEGSNLHHIRAHDVSCRRARKVARRAHRKALGLPLPRDGVREYTWRRWSVVGDLRGQTDLYRGRRGDERVRWRF